MAGVPLPEMSPWRRRSLKIPPDSATAWTHLIVWQLWMGMLVAIIFGLGVVLVVTSPSHIVAVSDLSGCYAPPPVALPCERIIYRGGALNVAFTALFGLMLIGVAAWLVWELWSAVEPKPITDDFLKLLNDSFGRNWRNPLKWPWARVGWAYGFTLVGASATVAAAALVWTLVDARRGAVTPAIRIDTPTYRLDQ